MSFCPLGNEHDDFYRNWLFSQTNVVGTVLNLDIYDIMTIAVSIPLLVDYWSPLPVVSASTFTWFIKVGGYRLFNAK